MSRRAPWLEHELDAELVPSFQPGRPDLLRATCACGWLGRPRGGQMAQRRVQDDARAHLDDVEAR